MKAVGRSFGNILKEIRKARATIELLLMKITRSGGTTLHMAIYEGNYRSLKKLVKLIETCDQQRKGSAAAAAADEEDEEERGKGRDWKEELADDKGNTPLHLAAKMGQDHMCYAIATSTILSESSYEVVITMTARLQSSWQLSMLKPRPFWHSVMSAARRQASGTIPKSTNV
ncbi:hypothetical protein LOK49_Contig76G00001 [Camellia lanceoleosa]|nr:hypothetical protein LOK49_Contig76G00001 [Camellia lanceoleosa]